MSETPKVKIVFNGKEILDSPGKPLLQAAIDAGIEVPHFCYHPGIGIEGSCRLCLVQVEGMPKLQTSCTVPLKDGMVVSSVSEPVIKARKGVLEFFLLNHPLDCPICDKGGECPLQNFSLDSGQSQSRLAYPKINKEKHQVIGEHIILDKERCVLCDRCVRFLGNLTGREELQIKNRGAHSEIFIAEDSQLTSGYTGNLADICPVGALTAREFRFRARPWEMKTVDSVCGECSLHCTVKAWKTTTEVLRLTPRVDPDVNEWWLCDRGRFSVRPNLSKDRLTRALRGKDDPKPWSREDVTTDVGERIRTVPKGDMAFVVDTSLTNEELFRIKALASLSNGGRVFAPVSRSVVALRQALAKAGVLSTSPTDLDRSKFVWVAGENLEKDHPVLVLRIRRLHFAHGLKVFTAGPGSTGLEGLGNRESAIKDIRSGWGEFIDRLNELVKEGPGTLLLSDQAVEAKQVAQIIASVTQENLKGLLKVGLLHAGGNSVGIIDQWDQSIWPKSDVETEIQRGKVQGLVWFGPAPGSQIFDEYAKGMRIFVHYVLRSADAHPRAHWVLPLDTFLEKKGTFTNTFGKVQRVRRATRVVEKGFEPADFIPAVSEKLGRSDTSDIEQVYEELARAVTAYPKKFSEIAESSRTYEHYERALWR